MFSMSPPTQKELDYHEIQKQKWRDYNNRPEVKRKRKEYRNSSEIKNKLRVYWQRLDVKQRKWELSQTPKVKAQKRESYYIIRILKLETKRAINSQL